LATRGGSGVVCGLTVQETLAAEWVFGHSLKQVDRPGSRLPQLWKGIAEISSRLGVQVFVTTHSRECLEAATRVFVDEDPANTRDFALIQLMRVRGEVVGRVLNEQRVAEALDNDIELR